MSNVLTDTEVAFAADANNVDQSNGEVIDVNKENELRANMKRLNSLFNASDKPTDIGTPVGLTLANASPANIDSLKDVLEAIDAVAGAASLALADLTDVVTQVTPNEGAFITYNQGAGQWQETDVSIPQAIEEINDTNISAQQDGDTLVWSSSGAEWVNQQPASGSAWVTEAIYDLTSLTPEDYKAGGDGSYSWNDGGSNDFSVEVSNSANVGASGELGITADGLAFSLGGDNPATSATSGTAVEVFFPFQQLVSTLNPTWPLRVLMEYEMVGTAGQYGGIFIDNDPTLRGNLTNGYNAFGASVDDADAATQIDSWESGSFVRNNSEAAARTRNNRLFLGLHYENGNVGVFWGDVSLAGNPGSNFPNWAQLKMHGCHNVANEQRFFFDADSWGLRIILGGVSASQTIDFTFKSLRIQSIRRD